MTDTPTNTILLRGLPQTIEETDVCCYINGYMILIYLAYWFNKLELGKVVKNDLIDFLMDAAFANYSTPLTFRCKTNVY